MDQAELYLAGGCFWGLQAFLDSQPGVLETEVGYVNGTTPHPSYEEVCTGDTGYAEAVRVVYAPTKLPLPALLELYALAIDPFSRNRQGNDCGSQYRTGVYYVNPGDRATIAAWRERLGAENGRDVAVETEPLIVFVPAEAYHQQYLRKHPGGYCHIGAAVFRQAADKCAALGIA